MANGRRASSPLRRDRAVLAVERQLRPQRRSPTCGSLFALLKRDATDLIVQKATELGASLLLPVLTARTNAARVNTERLAAIATEAAEQCERLTVPRIAAPRPLRDVLAAWPRDRPLFVALEREARRPAARVPATRRPAGRAGRRVFTGGA